MGTRRSDKSAVPATRTPDVERRDDLAGGDTQQTLEAPPESPTGTPTRFAAGARPTDRVPQPALPDAGLPDDSSRYQMGGEIARGGMGQIYGAVDRVIGRSVAVKRLARDLLDSPAAVARFVEEAQVTGQLEHPGIVPVYSLGVTPDLEPYFAMKRVEGRSLEDVILLARRGRADAAGAGTGAAEFGRLRLLTIFGQVCMAVDFAHSRGVVHRDLKPENVMVGDYGEVFVMDWGIAKIRGHDRSWEEPAPLAAKRPTRLRVKTARSSSKASQTAVGSVIGTPSYMPPEQAAGKNEEVDERSDVYALGAMLYEILTLSPPYAEATPILTLASVLRDDVVPPRTRAPERDIPEDLERVCLRAMAREKTDRYGSARDLYREVEAFIEGSRERERKAAEAQRLRAEGERDLAEHARLVGRVRGLRVQAAELRGALRGPDQSDKRGALWEVLDEEARSDRERRELWTRAAGAFLRAVELSGDPPARAALVDLHWDRFVEAERDGRDDEAAFYRSVVEAYDSPAPGAGRYADALRGEVAVEIRTRPAGARVAIERYATELHRLVPRPVGEPRESPVARLVLPMGSYRLIVEKPGRALVRYPFLLRRGEPMRIDLDLMALDEVGDEFVYVPGGTSILGGDVEAVSSRPRRIALVDSFAIGRFAVTCGEYVEFLQDVGRADAEEAFRRSPREAPGSGHYWNRRAADGLMEIPTVDRDGDPWDPRYPVMGVSFDDATAYCAWRSRRDGRTYRLPREVEWERAARGADGRLYPWGNRFDPTACKMRFSRPGPLLPEPIGAFPTDESPFGVRDMAGTVRQWCNDLWDESGDDRVIRGGAWNMFEEWSRSAARYGHTPRYVLSSVGFRLARSS